MKCKQIDYKQTVREVFLLPFRKRVRNVLEIVLTLSRSVRLPFYHLAITGSRYCGQKMAQARVSDSIFFIQSIHLCCHLPRIRAGEILRRFSIPFWINIEQNRAL